MAPSRLALFAAAAAAAACGAARAHTLDHANLVGPHAVDPQTDCTVRGLAYEYGLHLGAAAGAAPGMAAPFQSLFDALRLAIDCNATPTTAVPYAPRVAPRPAATRPRSVPAATYYADAVHGSDSNPGTLAAPFATVGRAVLAARAGPVPAAVTLRNGTFYLPATLVLTPADSGLTIAAYPGETATLSAGAPLQQLTWSPVPGPPGPPPGPGMAGPFTGSLLEMPGGGGCVDAPNNTNPGVCAPLGQTADAAACEAACVASPSCTGYTWHDSTTGDWSTWCYARLDGYDMPDGAGGHVCGYRTAPPPTPNVWSAPVPAGVAPFDTLFYNGRRAVRARWPNANPENDISPKGFTTAARWLPPASYPPPNETHIPSPARSWDPFFPTFQWGTNGTVANFTTGSFWGTQHPPAGAQYGHPSGLVLPASAPANASTWPDATSAIVHAFHNGLWGDWAFTVGGIASDGTVSFSAGGWQEARGAGSGAGFYIENARALIDVPGEWYFDEAARLLYFFFNGTANATDLSGTFVASQLETVVSVEGTSAAPVTGVTLGPGLVFAHTLTDYMLPYTVPSGGDWSFHDGGAVRLTGTVDATIIGSTFWAPGGNGLMIAGFNRGALVSGCEFAYTGASAIVTAGLDGWRMDGGAGEFPLGTVISGVLGREIGVYVKQSGFLYSGVTVNTTVEGVVMFSGSRAGININDGFGGGHVIRDSLGFNFVRETADHGVFNSWDREVYLQPYNTSALDPQLSHITRCFFINNYHSSWPIDHDDGSSWYADTYNFMPWGGSKQYLGFAKTAANNVYVYADYSPALSPAAVAARAATAPAAAAVAAAKYGVDVANGWGVCAMAYGTSSFGGDLRDVWVNNTCIVASSGHIFDFNGCHPSTPNDGNIPLLSSNTFATGDGQYALNCGGSTWTLAQAQAAGVDTGSVMAPVPTNAQLADMAHALLDF